MSPSEIFHGKILIVDDQEITVRLLERMPDPRDMQVRGAYCAGGMTRFPYSRFIRVVDRARLRERSCADGQ